MKGNAEDIQDLRQVTEDLIGIVAGRIDQLGDQARDDIKELHECAPLLFDSPTTLLRCRAIRSVSGVVIQLVDMGQSNGIVDKAGRILAADKWAVEIKKLKETVNQAIARWQVCPIHFGCLLPTNSPPRTDSMRRSPPRSTS